MEPPLDFDYDAALADPVFGTLDQQEKQEKTEQWSRVFKSYRPPAGRGQVRRQAPSLHVLKRSVQ